MEEGYVGKKDDAGASGSAREGGRTGRIVAAVALYGAALLLAYVVAAAPVDGTAMGAIRGALVGLGGSCASSSRDARLGGDAAGDVRGRKKALGVALRVDAVLFLCAFTAGQLFVAQDVIQQRMHLPGFANFVDKSYGYGAGGGAIGALLAWPLYAYFGKWGGLLATLLLALLSLTATGKAGRFLRWSREKAAALRHDSEQRRMVRENERMFDIDDPAPRRSRLSRRDAPSPEAQAGVETARRNAAGDEPFAGMTPPTNRRGAARGNRDVPCTGGAQAGAARGNRDVPYSDGAQTGAARGNRDVPYSDGAQAGAARGSRDVPYAGGSRDAESLLDDAAIPFAHDDAPTMAPFERGRGKRRRGVQPDTSEAVEAMRRAKEGGRRRGAPVDIPDAAQPDGNAHGVRTAASPDAAGFSASTDAARDGASASGRGRFSASGDAGFSASTDARDGASVSGRGRSAASGAAGFSASTDAARDGASASGRGRFSASGDAGFSASTDAARDGASHRRLGGLSPPRRGALRLPARSLAARAARTCAWRRAICPSSRTSATSSRRTSRRSTCPKRPESPASCGVPRPCRRRTKRRTTIRRSTCSRRATA